MVSCSQSMSETHRVRSDFFSSVFLTSSSVKWKSLLLIRVAHTCSLVIELVMSVCIGFLPWIDNWTHLGAFVYGMLAAVVFLPHITFGRWQRLRKMCECTTMVSIYFTESWWLSAFLLWPSSLSYSWQSSTTSRIRTSVVPCATTCSAFLGQQHSVATQPWFEKKILTISQQDLKM